MFGMIPFERHDNNLFDMFDNMERSFFGGNNAGMTTFRTDIRDEGDRFVLEAELPGFRKEDINLDINGDTLTISAQRNAEKEQKDDKGNYIRRERSWGSFARSFDISAVDAQNIKAAYTDGVLTLTLPKKTAVPPTARRLEIE